jgi:hypothetical protein
MAMISLIILGEGVEGQRFRCLNFKSALIFPWIVASTRTMGSGWAWIE